MRIVAVPGRLVRDPVTRRPLDADGLTVDPNDFYWARLIADGDAQVVDDVESEPEPAAESAPAEEPKA